MKTGVGLRWGVGLVAAIALGGIASSAAARWTEDQFARRGAEHLRLAGEASMVGTLSTYVAQEGDTLLDIGRYFGLGYLEIISANPGVDPWLPPPGEVVVIPNEFVLPVSRRGIVVNIPEMRLYYFHGDAGDRQVATYSVGLGRDDWRTPQGPFHIRSKTENPTWVIPASIIKEHIERDGDARTFIPGGAPDNPLGSYRLSLSMPEYGLHGTNMPWGVGRQVSHGCIRMYEEDIAKLYGAVTVGTKGEFVYEPVKVGMRDGLVYVEVHPDIYRLRGDLESEARTLLDGRGWSDLVDGALLRSAIAEQSGLPMMIARRRAPAGEAAPSATP